MKKSIIYILSALSILGFLSSCAPDPNIGPVIEDSTKKPYESESYTAQTPEYITEEETSKYETLKNNAQSAFALVEQTSPEKFEYIVDNGEVTIKGYLGDDIVVRIPEKIDDCEVSIIEEGAFKDSHIRSICIPDTVKEINKGAFEGCANLTTMKMPIPENLEENSLGYIFGSTNEDYNGVSVPSGLSLIIINGELTEIPEKAFFGFKYLEGVVLPETCSHIGDFAFWGCSSLIYFGTPVGLQSIGRYTFGECLSLFCFDAGENTEDIGLGAFYGCNSLKEIKLPFVGGSAEENRFAGYIFGAKTADWNVNFIPDSLYSVELYDSCISIADKAFYKCHSLVCIKLSSNLETIGIRSFYGCISLAEITIPDTVRKIEDDAFFGCINLERVNMSGKTELGMQVFYGCKYTHNEEK